MVDPPADRLQPWLLDRLTDDDVGSREEPVERRVISRATLKRVVLRDLGWLLNATAPASKDEWREYSEVQRSVLNYGMPPLSGRPISSLDLREVEQAVRHAIVTFEPRILPASLEVTANYKEFTFGRGAASAGDLLDCHNVLTVELKGLLWAQPASLELLVRTEIDLETGQVALTDLLSPRGR